MVNVAGPAGLGVQFGILTKKLAKQHAGGLLRLNQDSEWENWTEENLLSDRPMKWALSMFAASGGLPIAYGICSNREVGTIHLHHLVVGPEWRSRGIGRTLLLRIARNARKKRLRRFTLKVYEFNRRAVQFYARSGFSVSGQEDDLLWMEARVSDLTG